MDQWVNYPPQHNLPQWTTTTYENYQTKNYNILLSGFVAIYIKKLEQKKETPDMKINRKQLAKIIQEELNAALGEGEFDSLQLSKDTKGEVEGSDELKQLQNLTQRIHRVEAAFKQIGGVEQIVRLTRRVYALEQAAKKGANPGGNEPQKKIPVAGPQNK
jgi:hypothetical protein